MDDRLAPNNGKSHWSWYVDTLNSFHFLHKIHPVLAGFIISDQVANLRTLEPFTVAKKTQEFVSISTVYFSLSVATSLTTMLLINLRIFLVQRHMKKTGIYNFTRQLQSCHRNPNRVGGALFGHVVSVCGVRRAKDCESQLCPKYTCTDGDKNLCTMPDKADSSSKGLALLLTILRVATGHLRPQEEWSRPCAFSDLELCLPPSSIMPRMPRAFGN
jgi:hypothetical protein